MFKNIVNRAIILKHFSDEIKVIYMYRYFSLVLTSLFYFFGNFQSSLINKLIVIGCLTTASILLNYLYVRNHELKNVIKILVGIEVIGNTLILIPTGGINSPYIWYSLNTLLITISFLNGYYCWINLFVYLIFSTELSVLASNKINRNFIQIFFNNSNLILSFILVTVAAQSLVALAKKLKKESQNLTIINSQLSASNERIKESMEHAVSLYQAVHSFVNQNNKDKLISIIINYTEKITKTNFAFFCMNLGNKEWGLETSENISPKICSALKENVSKQWDILRKNNRPTKLYVNGRSYLVIVVKSINTQYGVLGIELSSNQSSLFFKENLEQLKFLVELSSMALEKIKLEEINSHLVVSEEQNRIANEIHDSVSQRLFSISCGIHGLLGKGNKITEEELRGELIIIKDSLNKVMKEIRETIFGLSWKKGGQNMFNIDIMNYINDVSILNDIEISFNVKGNEEMLHCDIKKAIYRIICEGMGNAIRHGRCRNIDINLDIKEECTQLTIADNGLGFNFNNIDKDKSGLGLKNMYNLVSSFNGKINVDSQIGKGTIIKILFINNMHECSERGEVV